jgi:hypothetical protein
MLSFCITLSQARFASVMNLEVEGELFLEEIFHYELILNVLVTWNVLELGLAAKT